MGFENKKPSAPRFEGVNNLKKDNPIAPEKAAKKLYTERMFTISKLSERAKRATREVDELTNTRLGDEQLHAFGTPSAAETAALQALTEKIQAKLKKAQEEVKRAIEAYTRLDQDLSNLGMVADNPMRLNIKNKRELGSELLEKTSERIQSESSSHEQELRRQAVREALRPAEPTPLPKVKKEKGPVTETLLRPEGETVTAGQINEFAKLYDEAARKDLEGVMTPEEVAERIQEATDRETPANLSEVVPGYTKEELAVREQKTTFGKITPTTSGNQLIHVARSNREFNGGFGPSTAEEFRDQHMKEVAANRLKPEASVEKVNNIDFNKLALELEGISEQLSTNSINSADELQKALDTTELKQGLNELISEAQYRKTILEFTSKKFLGLFGKPKFNKAKASEFYLKLANDAIDRAAKFIDNRPVTGEKNPELSDTIHPPTSRKSVIITRAPGKEFKIDTDVKEAAEEWDEMLTSAKMASRESSEIAEKNNVEGANLVSLQKKGAEPINTPETTRETVNFIALSTNLDTIKNLLETGMINDARDLIASLNKRGLRSEMNAVLDPKDHDKSVEDLTGKKGFFSGKVKFDRKTAIAYFKKLSEEALARGANVLAAESAMATPKRQLGDKSPINRRPPPTQHPKGLV